MAEAGFVQVGEMVLAKVLRLGRGQSGSVISFQVGIDRSQLSLIERGLKLPSDNERKKLARALNVSPDQVDQRVRLFIEMPPRRAEAAVQQPVRQRREPRSVETVK